MSIERSIIYRALCTYGDANVRAFRAIARALGTERINVWLAARHRRKNADLADSLDAAGLGALAERLRR